ncbi:Peroxiredoxin [Pseudarcicella hirudinis]|uniref:Peroxiredoxin n=1 Tax=Pseudarcicella hirudinis TaxID=1079859 RepID=A0A1I5WQI8_9BACT|nr:TlpA disulfide reductase family protein [Pseudarcicella hirudinis]SFQ21999.1 Peroxiredoxin [Pseudarcicella hirudinis]
MNKIILSISLAVVSLCSCAQTNEGQEAVITGKVSNIVPDRKVYLQLINGRGTPITIDSSDVKEDHSFTFKEKVVKGGGFYILNFFNMELSQKLLVILEGGEKVNIIADGMDTPAKKGAYQITSPNSKNVEYFNKLVRLNQDLQVKVEGWNKQMATAQAKKDQTTIQKIQNDFQVAQQATVDKVKALFPEMGTNLVALWATNFLNPETDLETLKEVAGRFKKDKPDNPNAKPFIENLKRLQGVNVGSEAPEIALKTPEDKVLNLSSLRGKYVLIDFWASWCGPCRRENPNVVRMYNKFKDKGFEIYGVSLDQDKDAWINAIKKDGLVWQHVSDLQFWNSAAAVAYGVQGIPATFLLDKNGNVIAKSLRGEELERKLEEVLK